MVTGKVVYMTASSRANGKVTIRGRVVVAYPLSLIYTMDLVGARCSGCSKAGFL